MLATFTMAVPRLDHSVAIVLHVQVHPVRWYHVDRFGEVVADACCKLAWYKHTIRSRGWRSAPGVDSQDVLTKIGRSELCSAMHNKNLLSASKLDASACHEQSNATQCGTTR